MLLTSCADEPQPVEADQWHASDQTLADRVERLANAGEADAALGVFAALTGRSGGGSPAEQRARLALARALIGLGRDDAALQHLRAISWADKSPAIATQVLSLEARLRWQQVTQHGAVVSGAIPAIAAFDAPRGAAGGPWLARREAYSALAEILDRGMRVVRVEGGSPELPASAQQVALARYAFGDRTKAELATELGLGSTWSPALALAVVRIHIVEHDIEDAAAVATLLWDQHAATPEAAEAYRLMRIWQLQRQRATDLRLWAYPVVEARLTALVGTYPSAEQAARDELSAQQDLNAQSIAGALVLAQVGPSGPSSIAAVAQVPVELERELEVDERGLQMPVTEATAASVPERQFQLVQTWPGLSVTPTAAIVAASLPAQVTISSEHRGEHQLSLWRMPDAASYVGLGREPGRARLPAAPLSERRLTIAPWSSLGEPKDLITDLGILEEGFYAVTVTARGCPVVVVAGFKVCDVDLHTIAGSDALVAWVVRRADGCGKANEPLRAELTLVRDPQGAAGPLWKTGNDAWRAGFRAAFLALDEPAWQGAGDVQFFAAGHQAGAAAAVKDPAQQVTLTALSDNQGLARWPLPASFSQRNWKATVAIDRSQIAVSTSAEHHAAAAWSAIRLAWADKPVVRPGETVRFKALLRDWDGEAWHRPQGTVAVRVLCGESQVLAGELTVSDVGTINGEVAIPPACIDGQLELVVIADASSQAQDKSGQVIAEVKNIALPPGTVIVVDDGNSDLRAGETRSLRVRVRDAAGEPLAGLTVALALHAVDLASGLSVPATDQQVATDVNGEAIARIPSPRDHEQALVAKFTAVIGGQHLVATSSWTTRLFPLPMAVELPSRSVAVGDLLRARVRLPPGATVQVGLVRGDRVVGKLTTVTGSGGWSEVTIPVGNAQSGATALRFIAAELGGGQAVRDLPLTVSAPPIAADSPVRLVAAATTVLPGSSLPLTLGTTMPGRDLMLIGGTSAILVAQVAHLPDPTLTLNLPVTADWAPNLGFKALAWLPGSGFTESARQEVAVLPIDRLLTVAAQPDSDEYRTTGQAVIALTVTDWNHRPVAGVSLSVGLVDERLYSLGDDRTPDLLAWFTSKRRVWSLSEDSAHGIRDPQAQLWRAIARRWKQTGATMAIGAAGGGGGLFGCRAGGAKRAVSPVPVLPEADSTIHWSADLRTDASGHATVRLTMPATAGRFRLTARANDASAAVLVGEVRGEVVVREPLTCIVQGPTQALEGDELNVTAELASRLPTEMSLVVTVRRDGDQTVLTRRTVSVPAGERRSVALPVTMHMPTADLPNSEIRRVGELLGRAVRLIVEVQPPGGEPPILSHHDVLLAMPGVPVSSSERLVADANGNIPHLLAPAGSAVWLRLRAWPDAAARRRADLLAWRTVAGPRGALAWLLAEPGQLRSDELARRWPHLGTGPADDYVRLVACRLGSSANVEISDHAGPAGAWLQEYGRSLGLAIGKPEVVVSDDDTVGCAAAAIALRETAPGAGRRWLAAQEALSSHSSTLAWVLGLDAATVAGDVSAMKQMQAELASREWTDDLTAVIALDLLPAAGPIVTSDVVLHPGGPDVRLSGSEWTVWSGQCSGDLRLTATPGALLALDLVVQGEPPAKSVGKPLPAVRVLRLSADQLGGPEGQQYVEVAPGSPVELGETLALQIPGNDPSVLPALVQLAAKGADIVRVDGFEETWKLPDQLEGVTVAPLARFTEMTCVRTVIGERQHAPGADTLIHDRRVVPSGLVLVEVRALGSCAVRNGPRLTVVANLPVTSAETPVFPLIREVQLRYSASDEEEHSLLLDGTARTLTQWQALLALCDPAQVQNLTIEELIRHPACGRRGHHTTRALRRWIEHEPLFETVETPPLSRHFSDGFQGVLERAVASRAERQVALAHQPFPAPLEVMKTHSLREWIDRGLKNGSVTIANGESINDWCWGRILQRDDFKALGYGLTPEEWVRCLRTEFGFSLRLGRGVPGGVAIDDDVGDQPYSPGGQRLGFERMSTAGLQLVALPDSLELRATGAVSLQVSVVANDLPLAGVIDQLNQQLAARGAPQVLYDPPANDIPITLKVRGMTPRKLLLFLTQMSGCTQVNDGTQVRLIPHPLDPP